jgi:hypothetical protein
MKDYYIGDLFDYCHTHVKNTDDYTIHFKTNSFYNDHQILIQFIDTKRKEDFDSLRGIQWKEEIKEIEDYPITFAYIILYQGCNKMYYYGYKFGNHTKNTEINHFHSFVLSCHKETDFHILMDLIHCIEKPLVVLK